MYVRVANALQLTEQCSSCVLHFSNFSLFRKNKNFHVLFSFGKIVLLSNYFLMHTAGRGGGWGGAFSVLSYHEQVPNSSWSTAGTPTMDQQVF